MGVFHSSTDPNTIFGIKEVHDGDKDLEGHFPGSPTYPGYAQDEFRVPCRRGSHAPSRARALIIDPYVVQKVVRYKKKTLPPATPRCYGRSDAQDEKGKVFHIYCQDRQSAQ